MGRCRTTSISLALLLFLALPEAASAHAFLVRSSPRAGDRLTESPSTLSLDFSYPTVPGSAMVSVRTAGGTPVPTGPPQPSPEGTSLRVDLPPASQGVYLVSWQVLATDGATTVGEFAFGVGGAGPVTEPVASAAGSVAWMDLAAGWLLLSGAAVALGGLASEAIVWRRVTSPSGLTPPRAPVVPALVAAVIGAAWQAVEAFEAMVGAPGGGAGRWSALLRTRAGLLTVTTLALLLYALWLQPLRRLRMWGLVPLAGAVISVAARGHSSASGAWWAVPANAIHFTAAGLWVGALLHLVLVLRRLDREEWRTAFGAAARRYASLGLALVLVAVPGGILTAAAELSRPGDLVETAYGRTLLLKLMLIVLALGLALTARLRAFSPNPGARIGLLRRLTRIEGVVLLGVVSVSALLATLSPPRTARAVADLLGPAPLQGPVLRLAALAGQLSVYLGAARDQLEIRVPVGGGGTGRAELKIEGHGPTGNDLALDPRRCGAGCFTMRFPWGAGVTRLEVTVSAHDWIGGTARFDVPWPPAPDEPKLLARVVGAMRAEPTVSFTEQTSSGPDAVGAVRPIRISGTQLMELDPYGASGADDVRRLPGSSTLTQLTLYLPGSYIWARLWVDPAYRIQREEIVTPGHLIERTSFAYDQAPDAHHRRSDAGAEAANAHHPR